MSVPESSRSERANLLRGEDGRLRVPPLYAILDIDCLTESLRSRQITHPGAHANSFRENASVDISPAEALLSAVLEFAAQLQQGGVRLLQYRAKQLPAQTALSHACALRQNFPALTLIMNDRADLCLAADFDGVHVGQDDLWPEAIRGLVESRIVGVSTHNPEQVAEAAAGAADYVAIGPVFATGSKTNPDPVVGLEGVRRARQLTAKPLVAIGGITLENCRQVLEAGADSVAIISALRDHPRESAERFLRILS
jgi:thiamine-phosphate pyrophosphorylase